MSSEKSDPSPKLDGKVRTSALSSMQVSDDDSTGEWGQKNPYPHSTVPILLSRSSLARRVVMREAGASRLFATLLAVVTIPGFAASLGASTSGKPSLIGKDVHAFLSTHCMDCHDDSTSKGDVSLEALGASVTDATDIGWQRALEQIERGTMPPAKKKQPSASERETAVMALESAVVAFAQIKPSRESTVLRRLTRTEYRRTLEDLLHLDLKATDPTIEFPEDTRTHGFASVGERLITSSFLVRQYLAAAQDVLDRAVHFEERPESRTLSFLPPFDKTSAYLRGIERDWYAAKRQPQPYQTLAYKPPGVPGTWGYLSLDDLKQGVAVSGIYSIRVLAEGKFRHANRTERQLSSADAFHPLSQPLRLAMIRNTLAGSDRAARNYDALVGPPPSGAQPLAAWDLPDDVPAWVECQVWLDAGQFPKF